MHEHATSHNSVSPSVSKPLQKFRRESLELLGWFALRAGMQMLLVVVVAKLLGAIEYGYFVATLATVSLFSPLAGLGLHAVIVRDGSLNPASISTPASPCRR